jgi:hypothetical protein
MPKGHTVEPVVLKLGKIEPGGHELFSLAKVWPSVDSDLDVPPPKTEEEKKEEELKRKAKGEKSEKSASGKGSSTKSDGSAKSSVDSVQETENKNGKTGNLNDLIASLGGVSLDRLATMTETWFDIKVVTTQDSKWLPAGHVVARRSVTDEQLTAKFSVLLPLRPNLITNKSEFTTLVSVTEVNFDENDEAETTPKTSASSDDGTSSERDRDAGEPHLRITWSTGAWATIGRRCGRITRWYDAHGRALMASPLDVCFWRAPTDNDRGGEFFSYAARWKAAGLDAMSRESQRTAIVSCKPLFDGSIVVKTSWTLVSPANAPGGCRIPCAATYTFLPSGAVRVDTTFFPPSSLPPIPRSGIRFAVPAEFDQAEWLGLGPYEAYEDRKTCVYMGNFEMPVAELHTPYVFPQENGRRADPR